jgi:hypothetical protein
MYTQTIENIAIKMAENKNGGKWPTHYTEQQKDFWRNKAKEIFEIVKEALVA